MLQSTNYNAKKHIKRRNKPCSSVSFFMQEIMQEIEAPIQSG